MRRPRDWVGTTVPSPWTRSYSTGRYNLEFAASAALGLVSRSRASWRDGQIVRFHFEFDNDFDRVASQDHVTSVRQGRLIYTNW